MKLTAKQVAANQLLGSTARHILLYGGSRSGKTFLLTRAIVIRALKAPETTHAFLRFRFNHLKDSIINDTMPRVMKTCFPEVRWSLNKSEWHMSLMNGSGILYGGLDDKERTEKILGQEHSTIYLNECSQISYAARNKAITRLAQKSVLTPKAYYDCNPPNQGHWTYPLFLKHLEPMSRMPLKNPGAYGCMQLNPMENLENLPQDYIEDLDSLPEKERRRFKMGEFLPQVDNALWTYDMLEKTREPMIGTRQDMIGRMQRIVVAVDPSGCSGEEDYRSDEIGIVVVGRDRKGRGCVLEDLSGRYAPNKWARVAISAYQRWNADTIIAERNFGGAMVEATIKSASSTAPVKMITASRGKTQRAEPVASLYGQYKVIHYGTFPELEAQYCDFSTGGYQGSRSPDRADAAVWGLTEVMIDQPGYGLLEVVK